MKCAIENFHLSLIYAIYIQLKAIKLDNEI